MRVMDYMLIAMMFSVLALLSITLNDAHDCPPGSNTSVINETPIYK